MSGERGMGRMPKVHRANPVLEQARHETGSVIGLDHEGPRTGARGKLSERTWDHVAKLDQETLVVAAPAFDNRRVDQTRKQKAGGSSRRNIEVRARIGTRRRMGT